MNRKPNCAGPEAGFTLLEIVCVLVIIGILGAVAVPKFFNVQEKAREKAIDTALAELEARIHQYCASQILSGKAPEAIDYNDADVDIQLCGELSVHGWNAAETDVITCTVTYHPDPENPDRNTVSKQVAIPKPILQVDSPEEAKGKKEKKGKKDKKA